MWQIEIHTWGRESGGAGSGIWNSTDGGTTWKRLVGQRPARRSRSARSAWRSARRIRSRVYALIETGDGVPLARQGDGQRRSLALRRRGRDLDARELRPSARRAHALLQSHGRHPRTTPTRPTSSPRIGRRRWTAARRIIDPPVEEIAGRRPPRHLDRPDERQPHDRQPRRRRVHHARIAARPGLQVQLPDRADVPRDGGRPHPVLRLRQHAGRPVGRAARATRRSATVRRGTRHPARLWQTVGGGESGWATPDPDDPNLVWSSASGSGTVGGIVTRYDWATNSITNVEVWPMQTTGAPAADLKYRFVWTFPLTLSPHDHNTRLRRQPVRARRPRTAARRWQRDQPDLTRNDKSRRGSRAASRRTTSAWSTPGVVFAIAESPHGREGLIWAGINDGLVHVTRDGGKTWTNVTREHPRAARLGHDQQHRAVALRRRHGVSHRGRPPGEQPRSVGLQDHRLRQDVEADHQRAREDAALATRTCVKEDPVRRGLLYLGTENGLYVSLRRRRALAAAPEQHAARAGVLARGAGALQRPRDRDVRPRASGSWTTSRRFAP